MFLHDCQYVFENFCESDKMKERQNMPPEIILSAVSIHRKNFPACLPVLQLQTVRFIVSVKFISTFTKRNLSDYSRD